MTQLMDDPRITSAEETGYAPWMQNWHEEEETAEDFSDTEMQTLKEALEFYARYYPEETVFVGAASCFFYIGGAEELIYKADAIGKKFIEHYRKAIKSNEDVYEHSHDPSRRIDAFRAMRTNKRKLEECTPLLGRKVLDVYPRITGGTAIIVEGSECGSYWSEEEARGKC